MEYRARFSRLKELPLLGILVLFSACSNHPSSSTASMARNAASSDAGIAALGVAQADFCTVWATGHDAAGNVVFGDRSPPCASGGQPMVFSVTHERANNTHFGDNNFRDNISSYMSDYFPADVGKWLSKSTRMSSNGSKYFSLALDSINFRSLTPTGRPIEDGWLFFGLNDIPNSATLGERNLILKFRYKISGAEVIPNSEPNGLPAGHRFILGFSMLWNEPAPRSNKSHFLEINLHKTADFHSGQARVCPNDGQAYDHCFYDRDGKYAEGQYFDLSRVSSARVSNNAEWKQVEVNISDFLKSRSWFHPPANWKDIQITPYFGVESKGKSRLWVQVDDFSATYVSIGANSGANSSIGPSTAVLSNKYPSGIFREGAAGFLGSNGQYCSLESGEHMRQCGYSQAQYDSAPQISLSSVASRFVGKCQCGATATYQKYLGLFRNGTAGFIATPDGYCALSSSEHLKQCGYSQAQYDSAQQKEPRALGNYLGGCVCK